MKKQIRIIFVSYPVYSSICAFVTLIEFVLFEFDNFVSKKLAFVKFDFANLAFEETAIRKNRIRHNGIRKIHFVILVGNGTIGVAGKAKNNSR